MWLSNYHFLRIFLFILPLFHFGIFAKADEEKIVASPLKLKSQLKYSSVAPGSQNSLIISLDLAEDHKAYVDMFKIRWIHPASTHVAGFSVDPVFKFEDKFSKTIREGMKNNAKLSAILEFPENLGLGTQDFEFEFSYQACTDSYCHFPKTIQQKISVNVVSAAEYRPNESSQNFNLMSDSLISALQKGLVYSLFFVFLAGVLTSLTPCVFPMIPITLAIIGARAAHQSKFRSFSLSIAYVLGIAVTYSILGIFAAKTGALFGSYLGHPVVVGALAIIFIAMGLSMFGLFELQVPQFITRRLVNGKTTSNYLGAFSTGLFTGIIASPCVGPVLVSILTYVAQSQDLALGFVLLFTFAMGFGQIFLWLGTFSGLLSKLPKSGPWMELVKFVFGSTMIAAALWYMKPVISERWFYLLIAITLVLLSSGFGVFEKTPTSRPLQLKKGSLFLLLVIGLSYGAKAVWYQEMSSLKEPSSTLAWQTYDDSTLMNAKRDRRPVIVDFWAEWCVACKELEAFTFSHPNVVQLSKEFTLLKVDATHSSELVDRLKRVHSVVGLPTTLFYNSKGELRRDLTLTGFENAADFEVRMRKALQ